MLEEALSVWARKNGDEEETQVSIYLHKSGGYIYTRGEKGTIMRMNRCKGRGWIESFYYVLSISKGQVRVPLISIFIWGSTSTFHHTHEATWIVRFPSPMLRFEIHVIFEFAASAMQKSCTMEQMGRKSRIIYREDPKQFLKRHARLNPSRYHACHYRRKESTSRQITTMISPSSHFRECRQQDEECTH